MIQPPKPFLFSVTPEADARRCFPAFRELRPHLDQDTFIERWQEQSRTGYTRYAAHRSHLRNGFDITCHHMAWEPPQPH